MFGPSDSHRLRGRGPKGDVLKQTQENFNFSKSFLEWSYRFWYNKSLLSSAYLPGVEGSLGEVVCVWLTTVISTVTSSYLKNEGESQKRESGFVEDGSSVPLLL